MENSVYNLMAVDIETTVAAAVAKCCADTSVSKEVRRERAMGLLKLGKIFQGKLPQQDHTLPGFARRFLVFPLERFCGLLVVASGLRTLCLQGQLGAAGRRV